MKLSSITKSKLNQLCEYDLERALEKYEFLTSQPVSSTNLGQSTHSNAIQTLIRAIYQFTNIIPLFVHYPIRYQN